MCELTLVNLHDGLLNRRLLLLLTSVGSAVHDDGFGIVGADGKTWKTAQPACWVTNTGQIMTKDFPDDSLLMGHIRKASAKLPINIANAHPFSHGDTTIMHNGGLTPLNEKEFVMDEEIEEIDSKTKELVLKKVRRSDTRIFFDEFLKNWTEEKTWDVALRESMAKFYGKFAFLMHVNNTVAVIRGKTADLYIAHLMSRKEKGKVMGYAVNTNCNLLDVCTSTLSNLQQLDGKKELFWTLPVKLKEETIYVAEAYDLKEIGEIKENSSPVKYFPATTQAQGGHANFTTSAHGVGGNSTTRTADDFILQNAAIVLDFMSAYSLGIRDISYMLERLYNISINELDKTMLTNFCTVVIPRLRKKTDKDTKRSLRKALLNFPVSSSEYYEDRNLSFPWMLSNKPKQLELVGKVEAKTTK